MMYFIKYDILTQKDIIAKTTLKKTKTKKTQHYPFNINNKGE